MLEYESKLNELLLDLFKEHGIKGLFIGDGHIIFLDKCIKAHCHLFDKTSNNTILLQLDVVFDVALDKTICESFTGIGSDLDTAASNAFDMFVKASFHTILAAFFTSEFDNQIERRTSIIASKSYEVITGSLIIRGQAPKSISTKWIDQFDYLIKENGLGSGINWVRLFYAIHNKQLITTEVLINNQVEEKLQEKASSFDITLTEDFYSLRVFYIYQNSLDIGRLSAIISWATIYFEGNGAYSIISSVFKSLGMSNLDIEKAYIFIPLAISHIFIKDIAPNVLTTKATIINRNKDSFEIDLNNEPLFVNTYNWAKSNISLIDRNSLTSILELSSIFNVLNQALNEGSKPENLEFSGVVASIKDYNIDKTTNSERNRPKKPFWKFW